MNQARRVKHDVLRLINGNTRRGGAPPIVPAAIALLKKCMRQTPAYTIEPVANGYRVMCGHLQLASFYHDNAERNAMLFRAALIARDQVERGCRDYVDYTDQDDYIRQA